MQTLHQDQYKVIIGRQLTSLTGVAALAIVNVFGEHVAFCDRHVAQKIAQRNGKQSPKLKKLI